MTVAPGRLNVLATQIEGPLVVSPTLRARYINAGQSVLDLRHPCPEIHRRDSLDLVRSPGSGSREGELSDRRLQRPDVIVKLRGWAPPQV
jgi:hypothetical protein